MAKRKATRRTQRKARGGAIQRPDITPEMPGITIRFDTGTVSGVYIGPPSMGGSLSTIREETPGGGSETGQP